MIVFDRDDALRAALSSGRNRPGFLVDFFFCMKFCSERRNGGYFMAKNNTNNFKPSMRKVKEALVVKTANRKANAERTTAARARKR
jgi:hypothetical protein